jgi:sirohydrochlorin ferrochelatase
MEPDIQPLRISPVDVASLDNREVRAALVLLAGSSDPAVAEAVVKAVQRVLERTRSGQG